MELQFKSTQFTYKKKKECLQVIHMTFDMVYIHSRLDSFHMIFVHAPHLQGTA